jgi:hypothetical protein
MIDSNVRKLLAIALLTSACVGSPPSATTETGTESHGDGDGDGLCTPELAALRSEIFTPSCALPTCHNSTDAAGGLDFEASDLEAELVGAPSGTCDGWIRVVPGTPDESLLYLKVAGPAPCGTLMPPNAGLPAEQAACVRSWIEDLEGLSCETCGGNACVDLESDAQNCGECGNVCPANAPCNAGECTCPDGGQVCDGVCVDLQSDPQYCGDCSTPCDPGQVCAQGQCADGCGALTDCGGACVDLSSNPDHCGECDNPCGAGSTCTMGSCSCAGDGVSFIVDVGPLLANSCTAPGCHGFPAPAAGLDLRAGFAYDSLVGVPSSQCLDRLRVAPGQPDASYLIDKITGVNLCFGTKMPKTGPGFTAEQIATISEWICTGALEN